MPPNQALPPKDKVWRAGLSDFVEIAFRYGYRNGPMNGGMQKAHMANGRFNKKNG
jgi:hypothetical protein